MQQDTNYKASNPFSFSPLSSLPSHRQQIVDRELSYGNGISPSIYSQQQSNPLILNKHPQTHQIVNETMITNDLGLRVNNSSAYEMPVNNFNESNIDYELLSKFNRMHTQSPQLPRKNYSTLRNVNTPSPLFFQHHNHHQESSQSPLLQHHHKFMMDDKNNVQHYHQNPYKPLQPTFSPVIKKRYGTDGSMVSEDLEFRILHGNTSPIVLQRFYHQQNQLRDQKVEELRTMKNTIASTNPFENAQCSIPQHNNNTPTYLKYSNNSPSPSPQRNINVYESNYNASPLHQLTKNNTNTNMSPYRQQQQYQPAQNYNNHPNFYNNKYETRPPIPNSPQLDRLRVNLEKPNFYERRQLPVEVNLRDTAAMNNGMNNVNENKNGSNNKGTKLCSFIITITIIIIIMIICIIINIKCAIFHRNIII
jgi:hypothetical protein